MNIIYQNDNKNINIYINYLKNKLWEIKFLLLLKIY